MTRYRGQCPLGFLALCVHQTRDIASDQVDLYVDAVRGGEAAQVGLGQGDWDEGDVETNTAHLIDREADSIHRNRTLLCHESAQGFGNGEGHGHRFPNGATAYELADSIDMSGDQVPSE